MDDMRDLIREVDLLKEQVINMKQAVQVFDVYMRQHLPDYLKVLKQIEKNTGGAIEYNVVSDTPVDVEVIEKKGKAKKQKIVLYTTPTCMWCDKARELLKELGADFKEINVREDDKAAKEMIELSGQRGVPVTVINGEVIVGFNPDAIKKELEK